MVDLLPVWKCPLISSCRRVSFTSKKELDDHTGGVHRGEKLYQCTQCEEYFSENSALKGHGRTVQCVVTFVVRYSL